MATMRVHASSMPECENHARRMPLEQVGWHLMLARLIAVLRTCIPMADRELFDAAHAGAHARRIPLPDFFSYMLGKIRDYAPYLEENFREVFRVRNECRRRAKGRSLGRTLTHSSSSEDIDADLEEKLQQLQVSPELAARYNSACGKRIVDDERVDSDDAMRSVRTSAFYAFRSTNQPTMVST
eukprot:CAMPEP_0113685686 /NCGR_PEP_ID=MMETSP0038_2-20120614/14826_1 /TAXON_ID=2898 /ORGANISM="Cryptomonas paramecium" /LENGTH=182 /DNA_ID=CAMNT_0000605833 /DNA_START=60 /DNA_END=608 /DNA_ORIENTATION=+ /assembly_acc=CAM_ASM_000170